MFNAGDMAMIVRHCGCSQYDWVLGKPFKVKKITEKGIFCTLPGTSPHMRGQPKTLLIAEKSEPNFTWAPASWCIKIDPSKEILGIEVKDTKLEWVHT